jgi:NAD(P)-dependent dehydrogenase (short-subunit alcohol dehydrogenase family)
VIRSERGGASVTFIQADHSTVGGNQRVADHVRNAFPRLNVLINNVGGLYETGGRRPTDTRPRWP